MTGWMSGNRAWKVGLVVTRVPDEHNTVCLVQQSVGLALGPVTSALGQGAKCRTDSARRTAKMDRSSFPRPSKVDQVDKFAAIGFAISNGCTVRMVCRGIG